MDRSVWLSLSFFPFPQDGRVLFWMAPNHNILLNDGKANLQIHLLSRAKFWQETQTLIQIHCLLAVVLMDLLSVAYHGMIPASLHCDEIVTFPCCSLTLKGHFISGSLTISRRGFAILENCSIYLR